jgi:UrcA family protein
MKQILNTMTLAAVLGLASLANSALASDSSAANAEYDLRNIKVHFGDLNPALPADASELLARVKLAARNACLRNVDRRQIFLGPDRKACMASSYANAVAAINAKRNLDLEAVAALHDTSTNLNAAR